MKQLEEKLYNKIVEASNIIHKKNLEPTANWIIVSSEVAEAIENLDIRKHRRKKLEQIFKNNQ